MTAPAPATEFPTPLSAYPTVPGGEIFEILSVRADYDPFNLVATGIFLIAILHTFAAARFMALAHAVQHRHEEQLKARGLPERPSVTAELLHFLGEVEVVFGLWSVVLLGAIALRHGWDTATHYVSDTVNFTEPLFVVVIMALASTRPIIMLSEAALRRVASLGGATPAAWWMSILTVAPLLGSFVTEPAAMTIAALLLARQFYDLDPSPRLKYATLGLLFVNISIGGTLTHFAAPPVLMVARPWGWDTAFMAAHFGWRAIVAIVASNVLYFLLFRRELGALARRPPHPDVMQADTRDNGTPTAPVTPVALWVTVVHILFMAWTVFNAHYPALFIGGFLFYLGFAKATAEYQSRMDLRGPMLVGFFLGGLVIHGGLQGWWIAPVLSSLSEEPLFFGSAILTAFNDNALITYLSTLVPNLEDSLKVAVVGGAVTGGGLTVIANAPNTAGKALLSRFFDGAVAPLYLLAGALVPTGIAAIAFRLL